MEKIKIFITSIIKKIKNYFFCLKYPFYKNRNVWTDKFLGYSMTRYEDIPEGWRKAFGKQLSEDLRKQLKKDKQLHTFRFSQIKEKWGKLRLYTFGCSEECWDIIRKYEALSKKYCIYCGKPATHKTTGYVLYLCKDHCKLEVAPDNVNNYKIKKHLTKYEFELDSCLGDAIEDEQYLLKYLSNELKRRLGERPLKASIKYEIKGNYLIVDKDRLRFYKK